MACQQCLQPRGDTLTMHPPLDSSPGGYHSFRPDQLHGAENPNKKYIRFGFIALMQKKLRIGHFMVIKDPGLFSFFFSTIFRQWLPASKLLYYPVWLLYLQLSHPNKNHEKERRVHKSTCLRGVVSLSRSLTWFLLISYYPPFGPGEIGKCYPLAQLIANWNKIEVQ